MIGTAFRPGASFLHRTDPRIKFFILVFWTIAFIIPSSVPILLRYYLGTILLIAAALSVREVFVPLKSIWPILLLVLLLTPPFHAGGEIFFEIGGWYQLTEEGLEEALMLILRFSGITSAFFIFFRSTSIDQFILALRWYGLPYNAALIITIAFRYIPTLIQLYRNIQDAHTLRRPPLEDGRRYNPVRRFAHIFPILVSVMIHSIKSIPSLSMALENRGFGHSRERTIYRPLPKLRTVRLQCGAGLIVVLAVILIYFL